MKTNHIHKYKKVNLSRDKDDPFFVFKCIIPTCTHYISVKLAEGKLCICNRCGEPMILNKVSVTLTKPHCNNCTKRRTNVSKITEFLEKTQA